MSAEINVLSGVSPDLNSPWQQYMWWQEGYLTAGDIHRFANAVYVAATCRLNPPHHIVTFDVAYGVWMPALLEFEATAGGDEQIFVYGFIVSWETGRETIAFPTEIKFDPVDSQGKDA